jgi:hypothetical protein
MSLHYRRLCDIYNVDLVIGDILYVKKINCSVPHKYKYRDDMFNQTISQRINMREIIKAY